MTAAFDTGSSEEIKVQRLCTDATIPTKSNPTDAGFDLYACTDTELWPSERALVCTGIAMAIPTGYAGLIWDRSGLSSKHGIHRYAGVIDSGYRGEIKVCLYNSTGNLYKIKKGDRIAQLLIQEVPNFTLVESVELDEADRGDNGFGSSGK